MGHYWTVENAFFGWNVHLSTLIMVWLAMAVVLAAAWLSTRSLQLKPAIPQVAAEGVFEFCRSITFSTAGKQGDGYLFFVGSLFLFILTANLMGQLPLKLVNLEWFGGHGELIAGTGDINTTAALAVCTVLAYFFIGIKRKGLGYFKHYFYPTPVFCILHLVEDITRPGSLMLRLFFNILVGEILSLLAMTVMPYVFPMAVILLEIFVAVVQAYIFAILSAVYIHLLAGGDHH